MRETVTKHFPVGKCIFSFISVPFWHPNCSCSFSERVPEAPLNCTGAPPLLFALLAPPPLQAVGSWVWRWCFWYNHTHPSLLRQSGPRSHWLWKPEDSTTQCESWKPDLYGPDTHWISKPTWHEAWPLPGPLVSPPLLWQLWQVGVHRGIESLSCAPSLSPLPSLVCTLHLLCMSRTLLTPEWSSEMWVIKEQQLI